MSSTALKDGNYAKECFWCGKIMYDTEEHQTFCSDKCIKEWVNE